MDFSDITAVCTGEIMLDRFVYGSIERVSPEAPVPVLRLTRIKEMLGGTANVATNIASLGARAVLVGLIGDDMAGASVRKLIEQNPNIEPILVDTSHRPTICKS